MVKIELYVTYAVQKRFRDWGTMLGTRTQPLRKTAQRLPLVVADVIDVGHDHQGHASSSLESLGQAGVEPRAVHHHVTFRSLLSDSGQSEHCYWPIRDNRKKNTGLNQNITFGSIAAVFRINRRVHIGPIIRMHIGPIGTFLSGQSDHFLLGQSEHC